MRYLLLLCLLFLSGCPNYKGVAIDWTKQPCQGLVPQPAGVWGSPPSLHTNLTTVYSYKADTVIPTWLAAAAAPTIDKAIDAELQWSNSIGVPRTRGTGNIEVYLYYNPDRIKTTSSEEPATSDLIILPYSNKTTSQTLVIPNSATFTSGQTILSTSGSTIKHAVVWIDITNYEICRLKYLKAGLIDAAAQQKAIIEQNAWISYIAWHENGHSLFGLSDGISKTLPPGTMNYYSYKVNGKFVIPFSENETQVIKWVCGL